MPTGLTAGIYDGKDSFNDFALKCARSFGACFEQRDDSIDAKPKKIKVDEYYQRRLVDAQKDFDEFNAMSEDEKRELFESSTKRELESLEYGLQKKIKVVERYRECLEKAKAYQPPTDDHVKFKEFMISQLEQSIDYDGDTSYYEECIERLNIKTFEEWVAGRESYLAGDLERAKENLAEREEKVKTSNEWIDALYKSLRAA